MIMGKKNVKEYDLVNERMRKRTRTRECVSYSETSRSVIVRESVNPVSSDPAVTVLENRIKKEDRKESFGKRYSFEPFLPFPFPSFLSSHFFPSHSPPFFLSSSSQSWPTRLLTYSYLMVFNVLLMMYPSNLSYDWQMGSIPLITSFLDIRNILTMIAILSFITLLLSTFSKSIGITSKVPAFSSFFLLLNKKLVFLLARRKKNSCDRSTFLFLLDNNNQEKKVQKEERG